MLDLRDDPHRSGQPGTAQRRRDTNAQRGFLARDWASGSAECEKRGDCCQLPASSYQLPAQSRPSRASSSQLPASNCPLAASRRQSEYRNQGHVFQVLVSAACCQLREIIRRSVSTPYPKPPDSELAAGSWQLEAVMRSSPALLDRLRSTQRRRPRAARSTAPAALPDTRRARSPVESGRAAGSPGAESDAA